MLDREVKKLHRRQVLAALGAGVGAAAVAACGGSTTSPTAASTTTTTTRQTLTNELATVSGSPASGYTAMLNVGIQI